MSAPAKTHRLLTAVEVTPPGLPGRWRFQTGGNPWATRDGERFTFEELPGRFFYLKDEATGDVWSATVHPVGKFDPGSFEARHGMGYTTIAARWQGVASAVRWAFRGWCWLTPT